MIVFMDQSFCASDCQNTRCFRHYGPQEAAAYRKWAQEFHPDPSRWPGVEWADFSEACPDYTPPTPTEKAFK